MQHAMQVHQTANTQASDPGSIVPWKLELDEAYFNIYSFILDDLDLRIGKQRIVWGTADMLNPTDNLNPDNFSDLLSFGKKTAVNSLLLDYYFNFATISLVLIPVMTPSVMPAMDYDSMFLAMLGPMGFTDLTVNETLQIPNFDLVNIMAGVKVAAANLYGFDISVSNFWGYDDIPAMTEFTFTPAAPPAGTVDFTLAYPRLDVVGLDFMGSLGPVGVWGEGALFIPIDDFAVVTFANPADLSETEKLAPYFKGTLGIDASFGDFYANLQYNYGFFDESGKDLTHMLMLSSNYAFLNGKLQLDLMGGVEIDYDNTETIFPSWIVGPQLSFKPYDATEIMIGAVYVDGIDGSNFGILKTTMTLASFKYTF